MPTINSSTGVNETLDPKHVPIELRRYKKYITYLVNEVGYTERIAIEFVNWMRNHYTDILERCNA